MPKHKSLTEYQEVHNNYTGGTIYRFKRGIDSFFSRYYEHFDITPASHRRLHSRLDAMVCYGEMERTRYDIGNHRYTLTSWHFTPLHYEREGDNEDQ